jgi:uncharacterized membrane protein
MYSKPFGNGVALDIQGVFVDNDMLVPGAIEQMKLVTGTNESQIIVKEKNEVISKATEEDNGHYVLVTGIYSNGQVRLLDPSFRYPRYLHRSIIQTRWWDVNNVIENQLIFLVTGKYDQFPPCLGMVDLSG